MRAWPSLKLLAGVAIALTATLSIRAVAGEQLHTPILIPNVQEPEEMRVAPFPLPNTGLTAGGRVLGKAITNGKNGQAMLPAISRVIASAKGESDAPGPYQLFRFELNCNAEQIRVLGWATYDASGSLVRSSEGGGRWGSVMPDTLGEVLEHGACGSS